MAITNKDIKTGAWIRLEGVNRMILDVRDEDRDVRFSQHPMGDYGLQPTCWNWKPAGLFKELATLLPRARWIKFNTRYSPSSYRHRFVAWYSPDARRAMIMAGCRCFHSLESAFAHYETRDRSGLGEEANERHNEFAIRYLRSLAAHMREVRVSQRTGRTKALKRAA